MPVRLYERYHVYINFGSISNHIRTKFAILRIYYEFITNLGRIYYEVTFVLVCPGEWGGKLMAV